jgi:hypothetical protein
LSVIFVQRRKVLDGTVGKEKEKTRHHSRVNQNVPIRVRKKAIRNQSATSTPIQLHPNIPHSMIHRMMALGGENNREMTTERRINVEPNRPKTHPAPH